jgi:hypothetical protein
MKSIRQKREIRSKGLVNPQIAPKNLRIRLAGQHSADPLFRLHDTPRR